MNKVKNKVFVHTWSTSRRMAFEQISAAVRIVAFDTMADAMFSPDIAAEQALEILP